MLHDSGVCTIYRVDRKETDPPMRDPALEKVTEAMYGEMTAYSSRAYYASMANRSFSLLIEIWRNPYVEDHMLCRCDDGINPPHWYDIDRVEQATDSDGILVTRLTLADVDGSAWEAKVGEPDG